ncbi:MULTISPECIES: ribbon-helix-helix domain-containing protein [Fischerella]|uniref:ribbon-helix-helix domain-containing protein n=1 Tax=Fischerella TaxID=1190 RepID=UPI00031C6CB5|nr:MULTISPECIES: ribbon-helix-helix domain-containing protein [Fischerella]MBD2433896.1 CopG family transcriptional regulator [Fischerella sp. FACHB-380]
MTDRRRCEDYKQVSGYVPVELAREFKSICAREGVSQSDALEEMIREWLGKKTASNSSQLEQANRLITIADVVRANMTKLKRCGVKNLQALSKGEVLPTPGDFAIIMSSLAIPEEEQKMIWQKTFSSLNNDFGGVNECERSESPKPTGLEL